MPTYNDYMLVAGHVNAATIQGDPDNAVERWPLQSDQNPARPWLPPTNRSTFPRPARVVRTADGNTHASGFYAFEWHFTYMTWGQLAYLDTLLSWSETVWSAAATVQTRDDRGEWQVYQVTAHRPDPADQRKADRGAGNVVIRFTNGVLLP